MDKLSTLQRQFVEIVLRNASKSKNDRRYMADERLLCLSIYKRSASTYRYLCTFLPIPSPRTVRQVLTKIHLDCGVTKTMKDCLKEAAGRMTDDLEKSCVLMWDEVSLKLHLQYCPRKKKVVGVEDWGTNRSSNYADHALVFLLRGIKSGWKIPLTYNFCAGQTTHGQLAYCIKEVVRAVTEAGFTIVASVCDQGSYNMKAIKTLQADTDKLREEKGIEKYWTILVDDVEFVPLYDPPHILKCIRNNFHIKDFEIDFDQPNLRKEDRKFGSWDHIVSAYEIDVYSPFLERNVPDLTEQHIYVDKVSRKTSRFVDVLARSGGTFKTSIGDRKILAEGIHTAFILNLMNAIADGLNGDHSGDKNSKRILWTENSYHDEFFTNARRQLKSMRFVDRKSHEPVKTDIPCLENLIHTLQGFKLLWKKLQLLGFKSFHTRNLNQDPLENFFESIKSHDFRSNKPTCYQFESIFKSLLITNLTSKHSPGFNCEEDDGEFILRDCNTLLCGTESVPGENDNEEDYEQAWEEDVIVDNESEFEIPEKGHIYSHSGDIIKLLQRKLPSIKSCSQCLDAFKKKSCIRVEGNAFRDMHLHAKRILGTVFSSDTSYSKLTLKCRRLLQKRLNFTFFHCNEHKQSVFKLFTLISVEKYAESALTFLNRILGGRLLPRVTNRMSLPVKKAYQCYLKTIRKDKRPAQLNECFKVSKIKKKVKVDNVQMKIEAQNAVPIGKKRNLECSTQSQPKKLKLQAVRSGPIPTTALPQNNELLTTTFSQPKSISTLALKSSLNKSKPSNKPRNKMQLKPDET